MEMENDKYGGILGVPESRKRIVPAKPLDHKDPWVMAHYHADHVEDVYMAEAEEVKVQPTSLVISSRYEHIRRTLLEKKVSIKIHLSLERSVELQDIAQREWNIKYPEHYFIIYPNACYLYFDLTEDITSGYQISYGNDAGDGTEIFDTYPSVKCTVLDDKPLASVSKDILVRDVKSSLMVKVWNKYPQHVQLIKAINSAVPLIIPVRPNTSATFQQLCFDMKVGWLTGINCVQNENTAYLVLQYFQVGFGYYLSCCNNLNQLNRPGEPVIDYMFYNPVTKALQPFKKGD